VFRQKACGRPLEAKANASDDFCWVGPRPRILTGGGSEHAREWLELGRQRTVALRTRFKHSLTLLAPRSPFLPRARIATHPRAGYSHQVCVNGGSLVCCASCPRAFHLACLGGPEEQRAAKKADSWHCAV